MIRKIKKKIFSICQIVYLIWILLHKIVNLLLLKISHIDVFCNLWKINSSYFVSCTSLAELSQFLMYENCVGGGILFGHTIVRTVSRNDRDSRRHDRRCRWPHVTIDTRTTRWLFWRGYLSNDRGSPVLSHGSQTDDPLVLWWMINYVLKHGLRLTIPSSIHFQSCWFNMY